MQEIPLNHTFRTTKTYMAHCDVLEVLKKGSKLRG